jgi:hypothetical protein
VLLGLLVLVTVVQVLVLLWRKVEMAVIQH